MPNFSEKKSVLPASSFDKKPNKEAKDKLHNPEMEATIDSLFEYLLLKQAEKVNEGNNGVIFLVDLNKIDPQIIDYLKEKNTLEIADKDKPETKNKEIAIKMLKVYTHGNGEREFLAQKRAYELVKKAQEKNPDLPLAKVARPHLYRKLDISDNPELQLKIKNNNVKGYRNQVEIIMLDYIPGKDLATFLYQAVLKYHPETRHLKNIVGKDKDGNKITALDELDIEQLQQETSQALKFELPPKTGGMIDVRVLKIFNENKDKLINFLKKQYPHGFKMPAQIEKKIKNTIRILHQGGLEHQDLHERNIVLGSGDYEDDIYIIDFGTAITKEEKKKELKAGTDKDTQQALAKHRRVSDYGVIKTLQELNKSQEEDISQADEKKIKEIKELTQQFIKSKNIEETIKELAQMNNIDEVVEEIDGLIGSLTTNLEAQALVKAGVLALVLEANPQLADKEKIKKSYQNRTPYQQKLINLMLKEL